jgi:chemotaxis protein MotB
LARSRRDFGPSVNIWPGFVDALSTLLLVFIFLLVVFVLGQFFLNQLLQGQDSRLNTLERAISELTAQLDMEQATSAELRQSVTQLSSDLQAAIADRDDSVALLADTEAERDEFRDRAFMLEDQQAALTQTLNSLRAETDRLEGVEAELEQTTDLRDRLRQELEQAQQTITADQETIELQLAQLVQLRRDIEALTEVRDGLDLQVAEMTALLQAAEQTKAQAAEELARLANQLQAAQDAQGASEQESERLSAELEAAREERGALDAEVARLAALLLTAQTDGATRATRVAQLSADLEAAREESSERERRIAELAAALESERASGEELSATAEELQRAREQLLLELSQVRDRSAELEASLASEQERTTLAQTELEQRDLRLAELLRSGARTEEELATEQTLSREALSQVDILNRQINALRVQLAALEQALDLEVQRVEEQEVTIADLGSKLNLALAGKVEELSRFRSEFFGRLRELLGDRPDVRIVGDRFVFQSEVLFPSASADIGANGREELRKLAQSLREIAAEMPSDVPWVLQVDGHTDRRPIRTPEFPSNWELSTARAINVGKFLVEEGIPPERIAVAGFGAFQPIDDRDDEIAYRRNRRIEIKLTNP